MSRWVAVDDSDGGLQYSGPWTLENGQAWQNQGNFGEPYLSSLHTIKGGTGSFSYAFDGSDGIIYGTTNVGKTASGAQDPVWSCQIDGNTIPAQNPFQFTENNWPFCKWANLAVGKHTITVTVTSETRPFMFDQFRYIPSLTADVSNSYIVINRDDKALSYGAGWQGLEPVGKMAPDGGAVVTFPFYGSGISWYGTTPKELPGGSTSAEYTIDGGPIVSFTVPGTTGITQYFQFYFQTSTLPLGHHTLQVTSRGKTSLTPLVLSSLIVQGGSVQEPPVPGAPPASGGGGTTVIGDSNKSSPASSITTIETSIETSIVTKVGAESTAVPDAGVTTKDTRLPTTTGATTPVGGNDAVSPTTSAPSTGVSGNVDSTTSSITRLPDGKNNGVSMGAIVGAALGGIAVIIIIICFIFFYRKRRGKQRLIQELEQAQPFYHDDLVANHAISSQASVRASGAYSSAQSPTGAARGSAMAMHAQMMVSNHDGNWPYSTLTYHEGSAYSAASLLQPNRRGSTDKHQPGLEKFSTSGLSASQRVVNHQDSGLRIPAPHSATPHTHEEEVVEFPPQYSAS